MKFMLSLVVIVALLACSEANKKRRRRRRKDTSVPVTIPYVVPALPKVSAGKGCVTVDTVTTGKCLVPAGAQPIFQSGKATITRDVITTDTTYLEGDFVGLQSCDTGVACYGWAVVDSFCEQQPAPFHNYQYLKHNFANISAAYNGFMPVSYIEGNTLIGTETTLANYLYIADSAPVIFEAQAQAVVLYVTNSATAGKYNYSATAPLIVDAVQGAAPGEVTVVACCQLAGKRVKNTKTKKEEKSTKAKKKSN